MNVSSDSAHRLRELIAQATTKYSVKDYDAAAELYSHATELQAEINGEMSSKNADLLYAYGRCLYHVAVKNSDVLGSKLSGENREEGFRKPVRKDSDMRTLADEADDENTRVAEEVMTNIVKENGTDTIAAVNPSKEYKPYFQFAGDENFDTGDEDEETNIEQLEEETGEGSAEDDFVNAYEMLDLARVLTLKQLKETETLNGVIEKGNTETVQQLKERLADTHDLQAEISLESEKFPSAVVDLKFALNLKRSLFSQDSSLLAEAHYKLSLALEFASITQQKDGCGEFETGKEAHIDDEMREEAAREMEAAIASCKLRIEKEEAKHPSASELYTDTGKPKKTKQDIDDVKDMVNEMEQRVSLVLNLVCFQVLSKDFWCSSLNFGNLPCQLLILEAPEHLTGQIL